jgi:TonB family protein
MQLALDARSQKDDWIARGVSLALHAALLAFVSLPALRPQAKRTVLLTVETVSGLTPLGAGTGVEGTRANVTDAPASANPLLNGVRLKMDEAAMPTKPAKPKSPPKPQAARPQSVNEIQKKYESMPLGLKPREGREAEQPSEGGMGNARKAGAPDGLAGISGAIGGRRFAAPDLAFPGNLPEEAELQIYVVVTPQGEVAEARVEASSGYPELNQFALAKAREFRFDPLPPAEAQENKTGILYFKFQYGGKGAVQ